MKRKNNWIKDNRGAALVSIMIAVAFISILASAILYMSYSNYQMKLVNYQSKVNFYGTEKDMTEVSTIIRNHIANDSDPLQELKDTVGFSEVGGITRYNPRKLADLVYPAATYGYNVADTTGVIIDTTDVLIGFNTTVSGGESNFIIDPDGETITLKGVEIQHYTKESETTHKITTDLVFRYQKSTTTDDPGGVGEFSVLMDSNMSIDGSTAAVRVAMYGNVFIGPGEYYYTNPADSTTVQPAKKDALVLTGDSVFTQKGDYMIVFGNLVLEDNAVLNVLSGRLTVFGDIKIRDNAALLCEGKLYMPEGNNPVTGQPYGINFTGYSYTDPVTGVTETHGNGSANNVIPHTITTTTTGINRLSATNYNDTLKYLGFNTTSTADDGILNQILKTDAHEKLMGFNENKDLSTVNYYGMNYNSRLHAESNLNGYGNSNKLIFVNSNAGDSLTQQDGSRNLNSTLISLEPVYVVNAKYLLLSQIGSDVFNMLIAESATEDTHYTAGSHEFTFKYYNSAGSLTEEHNFKLGSLFVDDPNQAVNKILGSATNLENGIPTIETAVGYANWIKE